MSITIAQWLVMLFQLYLAVGVIFAVAFIWRGVGAIDPVAADGTRGFKVLIFPGCVALWPLLLRRWRGGVTSPPDETNAHRRAAKGGSA
ncbi:MAG: hypothetical protein AAGM22_11040 [Acidobacteriota bacterium]